MPLNGYHNIHHVYELVALSVWDPTLYKYFMVYCLHCCEVSVVVLNSKSVVFFKLYVAFW